MRTSRCAGVYAKTYKHGRDEYGKTLASFTDSHWRMDKPVGYKLQPIFQCSTSHEALMAASNRILMLFLVGLELQPSLLWKMRGPILGLGGLQILAVAAHPDGPSSVLTGWRPVLRIIAESKMREVFTAAALLLVVAVTLAMQAVGLSPALQEAQRQREELDAVLRSEHETPEYEPDRAWDVYDIRENVQRGKF